MITKTLRQEIISPFISLSLPVFFDFPDWDLCPSSSQQFSHYVVTFGLIFYIFLENGLYLVSYRSISSNISWATSEIPCPLGKPMSQAGSPAYRRAAKRRGLAGWDLSISLPAA